jgi:shikimate kinase
VDSVSARSDLPDVVQRIVLVGFMGAGKSTVGRILARRIGWTFIDVDTRIENEAERAIGEIFDEDGEAGFRTLEAEATAACLAERRVVIATGGGWPVRNDRMGTLPAGTLSVWLRVDARAVIRRVSRRPGTRPLLEVDDPLARARALLAEREPEYARADLHVQSGGRSPHDVVAAIVEALPPAITETHSERSEAPAPPRPLN